MSSTESESAAPPQSSAEQPPRLLLVDPSRIRQLTLGQQLSLRGYDIVSCQSVPEALKLLAEQVIHLVLIEMETTDISGLDFLLWLQQQRPELPALLLLQNLSEEMRSFLRERQVLYFDKSWQLETLMSLIEPQLRKRGLDITAQNLMLFELMQLCVLSPRQRCLQLQEPATGTQGRLWFAQNRIVHAQTDDAIGVEALSQLMRLSRGTFQEVPWEAPASESIELSLDALMMGIATRLDEERHASGQSQADARLTEHALLVLSWNAEQRLSLEQHFRGCGFQVQGLARAAEALAWLESHACDLILLDQPLPDMEVPRFLEQMHLLRPQCRALMLVDELSGQTSQLARQWGVTSCSQKPVALGELEAMVRYLFSPHSFSGKLWNMSLLDYLQIVSFANSSKTLHLHDLLKETHGQMIFTNGHLIHAEFGELSGEAAFQAMFGIQRGLLNESQAAGSGERSIDMPLPRLLMRAMAALELASHDAQAPVLPLAPGELQPGTNLPAFLRQTPGLTLGDGLRLLIQAAEALARDHDRGRLYAPLKPDNIRLLPNQSIRLDHQLGRDHLLGGPGASVDYLAPEQIQTGNRPDPRADLFSFGAILYEIFTDVPPFPATTIGRAMLRVLGESPPSPRSFRENLPERLEMLILTCLEKSPDNRFASADGLVDALAGCLQALDEASLSQPLRPQIHAAPLQQPSSLHTTTVLKLHQALQQAPTARLKILHIEDDPLRLQMLLDYFDTHHLQYDCVQTSYVSEALQLISRQDFDFIVCDYILKDGTAEPILELAQGTPLAIISSLNQPEVIIRLMKKGAVDFIIKGKAEEEFRQIVELIQKSTQRVRQMEQLDTLPGLPITSEMAARIARDVENAVMPRPAGQPASPSPVLAAQLQAEPELVFQRVIGRQGQAPGEFASPRWLHYCPYRRNLLVADTQNSRIQILSLTGEVIRLIQHADLMSPCSVTRAADGRIYALDAASATLCIFTPEGALLRKVGGKPTFRSTFGLALLQSRHLAITDPENHCIHLLDADGNLVRSLTQDFKSPSGIAAEQNDFFVLDFGLPAVFQLDMQGRQISRFGKRGTGRGDFSVPKGISVNEQGHLFVAEALSHRIQVFDSQGAWLTTFGKKGSGEGEFNNPESLACRPGGTIYVLDRGNHRIQVFKYLTH